MGFSSPGGPNRPSLPTLRLTGHLGGADISVLGERVRSLAEILREGRKWDRDTWCATEADLRGRAWIDQAGRLTEAGVAEHARIEEATDAAAEQPWRALGADATNRLAELLAPLARDVVRAGLIPGGNPVGLTASARL
ncbi:helix-turn-helix domain-containing protein [Amycolatopsis pigmentata]|uniref:Uncharacterized protein n=1 Tax=Amycolatopsis pigmentata TaxID=450801 RepID=A0ABW5FKT4_9PSEU